MRKWDAVAVIAALWLTALSSLPIAGQNTLAPGGPAGQEPTKSGTKSFALSFSRDGQCVKVPDAPSLAIAGPLTLEAWVKADEGLQSHYHNFIISKNMGETGYCIHVDGDSGHKKLWALNVVVPFAAKPGEWIHIAGVFDGAEEKLYLNGSLVGHEPYNGPLKVNDLPLWIGSSAFGGETNWRGAIDEVRIWAAARTQEEIRATMHRHLRGNEPGLRACWSLDEGQGQTVTDLTGKTPPGELGGNADAPLWVPGIYLEPAQPAPTEASVNVAPVPIPGPGKRATEVAPLTNSEEPAPALGAQPHVPAPSITTRDGRTFKNVTVLKAAGDTVLLVHSEGATRVPLSALSDEARKALGLRTRDEQAAFEAEQTKKGLVKYGDEWLTPEEAKPVVSYGGNARNQAWVDKQYEKYSARLGIADGELYDLSAACAKASEVQDGAPKQGEEIRYIASGRRGAHGETVTTARVFQVINQSELLVEITTVTFTSSGGYYREAGDASSYVPTTRSNETSSLYLHLEKYDTKNLTDGAGLGKIFVRYIGTYSYPTAGGSSRTVPSYAPPQKPTKAEFIAALKAGSILPDK